LYVRNVLHIKLVK